MRGGRALYVAVCVVLPAMTTDVHASVGPPTASFPIPPTYLTIAGEFGIPPAIFYAIAMTESGTYVKALDDRLPWPWTLNIAGKGSYYPTRWQALQAARKALESGTQSIDVGLMQVNWRYHAKSLGSLESGLDPVHNLTVGARILAACHAQRGDWLTAVECYHAPNNRTRARAYRRRVEQAWRRLAAAG
jgi:hypothetical protein